MEVRKQNEAAGYFGEDTAASANIKSTDQVSGSSTLEDSNSGSQRQVVSGVSPNDDMDARLRWRAHQMAVEQRRVRRRIANRDMNRLLLGHPNPDYAPGGIRAGNKTGLLFKSWKRLKRELRSMSLDTGEDDGQAA